VHLALTRSPIRDPLSATTFSTDSLHRLSFAHFPSGRVCWTPSDSPSKKLRKRICALRVEKSRKTCGIPVEKRRKRLWISCVKAAEKSRISRGSLAELLWI